MVTQDYWVPRRNRSVYPFVHLLVQQILFELPLCITTCGVPRPWLIFPGLPPGSGCLLFALCRPASPLSTLPSSRACAAGSTEHWQGCVDSPTPCCPVLSCWLPAPIRPEGSSFRRLHYLLPQPTGCWLLLGSRLLHCLVPSASVLLALAGWVFPAALAPSFTKTFWWGLSRSFPLVVFFPLPGTVAAIKQEWKYLNKWDKIFQRMDTWTTLKSV